MIIKKYEDLIEKLIEVGHHWKAMHYFGVETTIEEFVESHKELGLVKSKDDVRDPIDDDFPYPDLHRKRRKMPMNVSIQPDLNVMNYNMDTFRYPDGTTHIACELYSSKEYWANLSCVCVKIEGAVDSPDSQWYLWKKVDDVYTWVACKKGTRVTKDVHSIDEIVKFSNENHANEPAPYFIDTVIESLPYSVAKTVLTIYRIELTELFEARHDVYKLTQYFDYDRVWPIYEVEDESYGAEETKVQNEKHKALNQLLYQSLNDDTFKSAYDYSLWANGVKNVER